MQRLMIGAVAALALAACNAGQPRIYRVALDTAPTKNIQDPGCFKNQMVPASGVSETNLLVEQQWVIWDGLNSGTDPSPTQYLDFGSQKFSLGHSPEINFSELIRSRSGDTPGVFTGQRVVSSATSLGNGSFVQVRQTIVTVTFNDMGASPTGTMALDAKYACQSTGSNAPCPTEDLVPDPRSCKAVLNFSARRIDVSRIAAYTEQGM